MRSRATLFTVLFAIGFLALPLAAQAAIPFFGPIVPNEINKCAAGWGAVITIINNIIRFLLTLVIVFVAPLMIAYSGFLFVVNPLNSGGIAKAKSILLNTIIGIVIAFAGWMIVDAIMAVLYHPTDPSLAGKAWSQLVTSGGQPFCLIQEGALQNLNQTDFSVTGISAGGGVVNVSGKSLALCSNSNLACSPAALQQAGLTQTQANIMSCIAVTESSGVPSTPPYNIAHPGSNSTACGTFQITRTTWNKAASGACSDFSNCTNASCNVQVAQTLVAKNGYNDWTCAGCNSKAASCVQQYGG